MEKKFRLRLLLIFLLCLFLLSFLAYRAFNDRNKSVQSVQHVAVKASPTNNVVLNDVASKPLLGWSSWSAIGSVPTQAKIQSQAQALARTLKSHGYVYANLDDYWYLNPATKVDQYGRWIADPKKFPDGIASMSSYVHSLGLKFGIYLTPGIPIAAVQDNTAIEDTTYHAKDIAITSRYEASYSFGPQEQYVIDYSKPGAQAYINSWVHLLEQWQIDFLKLDGIQSQDSMAGQVAATIHAWSSALKQSARPIYFDISGGFHLEQASLLRESANAWRIDNDIECYATCPGRVSWQHVLLRFKDVPLWGRWASPGGWNDLDSLDIGNGKQDGLTEDERQSYMSLWAIAAAPLSIGDDLTSLDAYGISLLTNDEVIAIDQKGVAGLPIPTVTQQQIWHAKEADGSYVVALFNLADTSAPVSLQWSSLGVTCPAILRDLWSHTNLGTFDDSFSMQLNKHASMLLTLTPVPGCVE